VRKYRIPTSKNIKKVLSLDDVAKIYYYECDSGVEGEQKEGLLVVFLFGNGMNVKDIAFLKWKDIRDDYLIFDRAKTERTMRSDPRTISVFITEDTRSIMDRWGNKDRSPNNYIFPILEHGLSPPSSIRINLVIRCIN